ncbi:MAG TPA: hypothetical protein PKW79_04005, partial [Rhabdochlamydiaceae bacterium]|nr:hypothetical protein [Rhabdochlamydiaceae bacterium]
HVNAQCLDLIRMTPGILATQRAVIRDYKFFNPLIYLSPNPNVFWDSFFKSLTPLSWTTFTNLSKVCSLMI